MPSFSGPAIERLNEANSKKLLWQTLSQRHEKNYRTQTTFDCSSLSMSYLKYNWRKISERIIFLEPIHSVRRVPLLYLRRSCSHLITTSPVVLLFEASQTAWLKLWISEWSKRVVWIKRGFQHSLMRHLLLYLEAYDKCPGISTSSAWKNSLKTLPKILCSRILCGFKTTQIFSRGCRPQYR